jgi:hypothetical protein
MTQQLRLLPILEPKSILALTIARWNQLLLDLYSSKRCGCLLLLCEVLELIVHCVSPDSAVRLGFEIAAGFEGCSCQYSDRVEVGCVCVRVSVCTSCVCERGANVATTHSSGRQAAPF